MQFVMLIYHGSAPLPGSDDWKALPRAEQQEIYADYAELNQDPHITLRLPPIAPGKAATVQVRDGQTLVKDGSHLAESVGGVFVTDVENLEAAVALAARIPQARTGGAVEIRPVERYF